jgi:DNA-binding LacI/PurR family transcriptional regulator
VGIRLSLQHLAHRGRRRAGLVLGRLNSIAGQQRYNAFITSSEEHGFRRPMDCIWADRNQETEPQAASVARAAEELVEQGGCDALVEVNDR